MRWRAFSSRQVATDPPAHSGYIGRVLAEQPCHDGSHHSAIGANDCARAAAIDLNKQQRAALPAHATPPA